VDLSGTNDWRSRLTPDKPSKFAETYVLRPGVGLFLPLPRSRPSPLRGKGKEVAAQFSDMDRCQNQKAKGIAVEDKGQLPAINNKLTTCYRPLSALGW